MTPDDPRPSDYALDDDTLDAVFRDEVQPFLFDGYPKDQPRLTLVLLGGQPGAGKSAATAAVAQRHPGRLVPLTGDELRQFHADYDDLRQNHPHLMPNATAQASGAWVARAIDHALEEKYSLVLEGVFRDPLMVVNTAKRFAEAGYRVEVIGLAVPQHDSLIATVGRYLKPADGVPRWTPITAHDSAYRMIPATLQACEDSLHVNALAVTNRRADALYANVRETDGQWRHPAQGAAVAAALAERNAPPTPAQARDWLQTYLDYAAQMCRRGEVTPNTAGTMSALADEAVRMAATAYPGSPVVADALRSRQFEVLTAERTGVVKAEAIVLPPLAADQVPRTQADPRPERGVER